MGLPLRAVNRFMPPAKPESWTGVRSALRWALEAMPLSRPDSVADEAARDRFLAKYDAKHALVESGSHQFTLNVGADDWPLPIPLVDNAGKWYFDGAAGQQEIVYRRIGSNELSAIEVCKGVVAVQRDYAASSHDGHSAGIYAERVVSDAGKQNGLYWETKSGEPTSPAGAMLAQASREGYDTSGNKTPYHGYYYRMLKNPGGFAFLAYPGPVSLQRRHDLCRHPGWCHPRKGSWPAIQRDRGRHRTRSN
ncbi:DUF2950 family protein [Edaphobacter modestus]|uniref:DUF2950 family protein n=2 Tax=Edaphobacter modestus TaxID=388466 RepID=A0A4Q7YW14_9BACT|nr:DUF2950 family protein [Edaphobacter modestus]